MNTIILGAGITGLAAGLKTGATIFEANNVPGGICRSYGIEGYRFDNGGGHWIFGDNEYKRILGQYSDMKDYKRKAAIKIHQTFPYPIQYDPDAEDSNPGTLREWNHRKFGYGLCNVFFDPFNERYTAGYYNHVVQDDERKSPTQGSGYNDVFSYPRRGLDHLVDEIAKDCDIEYNMRAVNIDTDEKVVTFSNGQGIRYDRIISTIPLDVILKLSGVLHKPLPYTSVLVLNIGAERGPYMPDDHWTYFPNSRSKFFRVGCYSNVDPMFAPEGKVSLYVERTFDGPQAAKMRLNFDRYQADVIAELQQMGWIKEPEVVDSNWIPHGYTWMFPGDTREKVLKYLKKRDILSIGRYGKWKFQGILESFEDGLDMTI